MTAGKFILKPFDGFEELKEDGEVFDIMSLGTE